MTSKKYKIIGFDLDDVLLDFNGALCDYHNSVYGTHFEKKDIFSYELEKVWGCTWQESIKRIFDFYQSDMHFNAKPVHGAVEGIRQLAKNHALFVVTSKPEILRETTLRWLAIHFPGMFKEVYFMNHVGNKGEKRPKGEVCKEIGVQIFVDDSLEHAKDISGNGTPVLLFNNPWNQASVDYPIFRVNSWKEIMERLSMAD